MTTATRPALVGIVNITDDSFSDGGRYNDTRAAVAHARALFDDGADFVELSAQSSNPDAVLIGAERELERLEPVLDALDADRDRTFIDSFEPEVQLRAARRGGGRHQRYPRVPPRPCARRPSAPAARG